METIDLSRFRHNAELKGVCGEYSAAWDSCIGKKQLFDLACDVNGADYLCGAIAQGWGLSPQYISEKFSHYLNGKYICKAKDYTSQIYCQYKGDMICDTTLLVLIDCDIEVQIPRFHFCEIYVTGNSKVSLVGQGSAIVVGYGSDDKIAIETDNAVQIKIKRVFTDGN